MSIFDNKESNPIEFKAKNVGHEVGERLAQGASMLNKAFAGAQDVGQYALKGNSNQVASHLAATLGQIFSAKRAPSLG